MAEEKIVKAVTEEEQEQIKDNKQHIHIRV